MADPAVVLEWAALPEWLRYVLAALGVGGAGGLAVAIRRLRKLLGQEPPDVAAILLRLATLEAHSAAWAHLDARLTELNARVDAVLAALHELEGRVRSIEDRHTRDQLIAEIRRELLDPPPGGPPR